MNPTAPTLAHWLTNARTSWHIPAFVGAFLALISYWVAHSPRRFWRRRGCYRFVCIVHLVVDCFTLTQQPKRRTLIQNLQVTTEALAEPRVHVFKATSRLNDLKLLQVDKAGKPLPKMCAS